MYFRVPGVDVTAGVRDIPRDKTPTNEHINKFINGDLFGVFDELICTSDAAHVHLLGSSRHSCGSCLLYCQDTRATTMKENA